METTPTLFEYLGGASALEALMTRFYSRVKDDAILGPVFASMSARHPQHVAAFVGEVLGGPPEYSRDKGAAAHHTMLMHHFGRHLTEVHRKRWLDLLLDTADEVGLPDDPEFRSAFVSYLEWGSRLAVINSNLTEAPADPGPMPRWGWGVVGGPYRGDDAEKSS